MVGEAVAAVARGLFLLALLLLLVVVSGTLSIPRSRVILAVLEGVLVRVRFRIRVHALVVEDANAFAGFLASADVHVPQTRARVVVSLGGVRGRALLAILQI